MMNKTTYEKQNVDCGACGSETCYDMARKIALNVNIPGSCIIKAMEDAREEHEQNILAHQESKAKSNFLATMSHEIRTPMNAILGITEIQMQDDSLTPELKEALGKIYSSGDLLLGIINDILDMSKIEAGKLELIVERYDVPSLINDTVQLNMMRIGSKPIEFELHVDENTPSTLLGDELRVKQIMNNLLSNAFKYTAEGNVILSFSYEVSAPEDPNITLVIRVSDTGQGMTDEQVSKLFDDYSRFNQQANRTTEGAGLGMGITKNLINMMNGEISVESTPGKGSVFSVRLPQGKVDAGVLGKELAENLQQFRLSGGTQMKRVQITRDPMPYASVLIVDDVETNIYVAKGLMAPYGMKIDSADSGFAAIEKISGGKVYDIVFMDHMMPKMDGIETTKKIRDMGYKHPIVALTANAVVGQSEIFLENGFDEFISKPIDIRQLNVVLNKLIRDKYPPEVVEAARREAASEKKQHSAEAGKPSIDPKFLQIFARDAIKAVAALGAIIEKGGAYSEDDLRMYIINVHGMKSALANIGQSALSALALNLEQEGRAGNTAVISLKTPEFLKLMLELIEKITPKKESEDDNTTVDDMTFLREKLLELKTACEAYNKKTAKILITELKEKTWSKQTAELLDIIAEHLLHSDFDEVVAMVDNVV